MERVHVDLVIGDENRDDYVAANKICTFSRIPCIGEGIELAGDFSLAATITRVNWHKSGGARVECQTSMADALRANGSPECLQMTKFWEFIIREEGWEVYESLNTTPEIVAAATARFDEWKKRTEDC